MKRKKQDGPILYPCIVSQERKSRVPLAYSKSKEEQKKLRVPIVDRGPHTTKGYIRVIDVPPPPPEQKKEEEKYTVPHRKS